MQDLTPEEEKELEDIEKYSRFKKPRDKLFLKFFKKFRGMIEIVNTKTNKIQKVYYQKPFVSFFTTDYIKEHLVSINNKYYFFLYSILSLGINIFCIKRKVL